MDFKHNFIKCNILTSKTPPQSNICSIFFLRRPLSILEEVRERVGGTCRFATISFPDNVKKFLIHMLDSSTSSFPFSKEGSWKCICTSNFRCFPRLIYNLVYIFSKFNDTIDVIINYAYLSVSGVS